jgi:V8-like Glu-specific endopeptidase
MEDRIASPRLASPRLASFRAATVTLLLGCSSPTAGDGSGFEASSAPADATVAAAPHSELVHPTSGTAPTVPEDWIGYELEVSPPTVRYLGTVEESALGSDLGQFFGEGDPGEPPALDPVSEVGPETMLWIEVNAITGDVYELTMTRADVYAVHEWMVEHDFDKPRGPGGELLPDDPSMGANAELPDVQELQAPAAPGKGSLGVEPRTNNSWSDNDDSRSRLAIIDGFSANHFPFRTISWMDGGIYGCTGTLIGQKILLTAAHCVWDTVSNSFVQHDIHPRRNGTISYHGSAGLDRYWINASYTNESCGSGESCNKYDIAAVELTEDMGDVVGAMGFAATNTTATESYQIRMRGYPSCHADYSDQRPAGCSPTANMLYGSAQDCDASNFHAGGCYGDGWYCEFEAPCDGSGGQSGSAAYTYDISGFGGNPGAIGVYSQSECAPEDCENNSTPNHFTRITPDQAAVISLAKSVWNSW